MPYIQGGLLQQKRSIWRLSIISDTFWAIFFYFKVFWMTMFSRNESNSYQKPKSDRGSGFGGGWDGGAPPGGPGTGGSGNNPRRFGGMSSIRGIDHNATCGSCCG